MSRHTSQQYVTEWNGLKVPAEYDCDIFCHQGVDGCGDAFWGNHHYFVEVPSRWHACWMHFADIKFAVLRYLNHGPTLANAAPKMRDRRMICKPAT